MFWETKTKKPEPQPKVEQLEPYSPGWPTCSGCMFWVQYNDTDQKGQCHVHAPDLDGWPDTSANDWCGEHEVDESGPEDDGGGTPMDVVEHSNVIAFTRKAA